MFKIKCYSTSEINIGKTFGLLTEKIYQMGGKTQILFGEEDKIAEYDKILWTFSRTKFIPHATCQDQFINAQPIILSNDLKNFTFYQNFIIINPTQEIILKLLALPNIINHAKHLIILISLQKTKIETISGFFNKSFIAEDFILESFIQDNEGNWAKYKQ